MSNFIPLMAPAWSSVHPPDYLPTFFKPGIDTSLVEVALPASIVGVSALVVVVLGDDVQDVKKLGTAMRLKVALKSFPIAYRLVSQVTRRRAQLNLLNVLSNSPHQDGT